MSKSVADYLTREGAALPRTLTNAVILSSSALLMTMAPSHSIASPDISGGVWFNYQYQQNDESHKNSWGVIDSEALVIYADGQVADTPWSYSAETRFGPGAFTDTENNSTGGQFALHKAWVGYQFDDGPQVLIGKSQVPFAWATYNFWPGDMFLAGYGDQMDVGVKVSQTLDRLHYDAALFLADDWSTSTDTMDDNGHWGSKATYRKVQTLVGNLSYALNDYVQVGVSAQSGGLQELISGTGEVSGDHSAAALYYTANYYGFWGKVSAITTERNLPEEYLDATIENTRYAAELGYSTGNWSFYTDLTYAEPGTEGNDSNTIRAFAPGLSYKYGPGWMYLEYLTQNGYFDRDGQALEGDFDALYATIDFYF